MRRILAVLLALVFAASAAADVVYFGAQGQTLYVRVNRTGDTAFDLTQGNGLQVGQYTATNATIAATSLPAGKYSYRVFIGTAAAQAAADIDVGAGSMIWSGSATLDGIDVVQIEAIDATTQIADNSGAGTPLSPTYPAKADTWRFESPTRLTANNTISETTAFDALLAMDLSGVLAPQINVKTVVSVTIVPTAGDEPVLAAATISQNGKEIHVPADCTGADVGQYEFIFTYITTDNQQQSRKGLLTL